MKLNKMLYAIPLVAVSFLTAGCDDAPTWKVDPAKPEVSEEPSVDPNEPSTPVVKDWRPADGLPLISDELDYNIWYSTGRLRTTSAVMQSFDFDMESNLVYYTQLNSNYRVYLSWGERNGTNILGSMEMRYFGHGSNFSLEKDGDKLFIWIGNYASKNSSGEYWYDQIISRVPVVNEAVVNPWDCTDNYYFGERNISVAIDKEHDRLTILGISSGRIRTYSLSALQALPVTDVVLESIIFGGDTAPDTEQSKVYTVKARDCRNVTPLGDFSITRETGISWQGFDVYGDVVYQMRGNGNDNDSAKASTGWLYIYKIDGTPILQKAPVKAIEDLARLKDFEITDTGYMEPEGVKVRRGTLYIGFASKNSGNVRKGTIFKYSPTQVENQ